MNWSTLVGQKTLLPFYGVDNHAFKLGNQVWIALMDGNDGYRSYLNSVEAIACRANGTYQWVEKEDGVDIPHVERLIFFDVPLDQVLVLETSGTEVRGYVLQGSEGHPWLEFGTDHSDSYYPHFVFRYAPMETLRLIQEIH